MFGKNPVAPLEHDNDGRMLHVVGGSPFPTIQGEGPWIGHPASFIRLHGCNLRCTFCDTQFSDPEDPMWEIQELSLACSRNGYRLVVITGGEPLRQNILPLCTLLHRAEFLVQIETAGTTWIPGLEAVAKIIVSPKTSSLNPQAYEHATAFKYVISDSNRHFDYIPITATQPGTKPRRLAEPRPGAPVYLSPMDEYDEERNGKNRKLVGRLALQYNVIAGVQLHKMLEIDEP